MKEKKKILDIVSDSSAIKSSIDHPEQLQSYRINAMKLFL